jgi:lysozyme
MNTLGSAGEALMKSFEKLALVAYPDEPGGVWTIGYGHTQGVQEHDTCTGIQADMWFDQDISVVVYCLDRLLLTNVSQNQFDALVSFTFNVGIGAEQHSTMLKLINERRFVDAANEFPRWNHVKGVVSEGLTRRRAAEQALFVGGDWQNPKAYIAHYVD